jgi:hypothetical protein
VFVVFALVTKADKGKTRLKPDGATKQPATSNKRPKPVPQGQKGIAGFLSRSYVTHANTAQVEGPLPYYARVRNNETGPAYLAKYVREFPWLRWGVHPLIAKSAACVEDAGFPTPEKVLYCADCVDKDRQVQKNGAANPFYQGYREFTYRPDTLKSHAKVHVSTIGHDDN